MKTKKTFWVPDKDQHVYSVERAMRRLTDDDDDEQKCMFTLSFPVDLEDDNKIPTLIEFNSMRTFLTYKNPNVIYSLLYADNDHTSVEEVIVEWVDEDSHLHNPYGPAHVSVSNEGLHMRYFTNRQESSRHYLKHQYEVTHLDVVDDDHFHKGGKAMLLADLAGDHIPFWDNWIKNFEEEHHIMDVILPTIFHKVSGDEEEKKEAEAEDTCDVLRSKPISNLL